MNGNWKGGKWEETRPAFASEKWEQISATFGPIVTNRQQHFHNIKAAQLFDVPMTVALFSIPRANKNSAHKQSIIMKTCFELLEVALELIKQRKLYSHSKNNNK